MFVSSVFSVPLISLQPNLNWHMGVLLQTTGPSAKATGDGISDNNSDFHYLGTKQGHVVT